VSSLVSIETAVILTGRSARALQRAAAANELTRAWLGKRTFYIRRELEKWAAGERKRPGRRPKMKREAGV
jgi:hypothetical protein